MKWSDIPMRPTAKMLRQFAAAWLVFFLVFGAHQYLARGHHALGLAIGSMALVVGVLGLVWPGAVRWIFVSWMVLAFPIGWLVSQVMLAVMLWLAHAVGVPVPVAGTGRVGPQAGARAGEFLGGQARATGYAKLFSSILRTF
jgi:hypothetical protein